MHLNISTMYVYVAGRSSRGINYHQIHRSSKVSKTAYMHTYKNIANFNIFLMLYTCQRTALEFDFTRLVDEHKNNSGEKFTRH